MGALRPFEPVAARISSDEALYTRGARSSLFKGGSSFLADRKIESASVTVAHGTVSVARTVGGAGRTHLGIMRVILVKLMVGASGSGVAPW